MRKVAMGVAALGLALTACSTDGEGPQVGGVAAEVDGETIALADVESLTSAYCVVQSAQGVATSRSEISDAAAAILVQGAIVDALGLAADATSGTQPSQVPGWSEMDEDQQDAFGAFIDTQARLESALIELGGAGSEDLDAAMAAGAEALAARVAEELEVSVNPRYGFKVVDGEFLDAEALSVGVSDTATASPDDTARLADLPASQVCGALPQQQAATG